MMFLFEITINEYKIASLIWNLTLLFIPFFLFYKFKSLYLKTRFRGLKHSVCAFLLFFLWLLFLPNTAYVITDIRHIQGFCPDNYYKICVDGAWMLFFFFLYSLAGFTAFILAVRQMRDLLSKILRIKKTLFTAILIPVMNLGVMLGLLGRLNSWEAFKVKAISFEIIKYFTQLSYAKTYILSTIILYAIFYAGDIIISRDLGIKRLYELSKDRRRR